MKHLLIFPMAVYVFYMFAFAIFMFLTRVRSIREGKIPIKYFRVYDGDHLPERLELFSQHYENQFEVPILFLITCTVFIALDFATTTTLILAWVFVISRGFHAWIHLGKNEVQKRAAAFVIGWLAIFWMWVQLSANYLI
jgi:hypothetical protein